MDVKVEFGEFGMGIMPFGGAEPGARAAGVGTLDTGTGAGAGAGVAFGAGVEGGSATGSGFGFGFILVMRNDSFAPVPLGSHSIKLYEGK